MSFKRYPGFYNLEFSSNLPKLLVVEVGWVISGNLVKYDQFTIQQYLEFWCLAAGNEVLLSREIKIMAFESAENDLHFHSLLWRDHSKKGLEKEYFIYILFKPYFGWAEIREK